MFGSEARIGLTSSTLANELMSSTESEVEMITKQEPSVTKLQFLCLQLIETEVMYETF